MMTLEIHIWPIRAVNTARSYSGDKVDIVAQYMQSQPGLSKWEPTREGRICVDRIYHVFFSNVLCFPLLSLPSPYEDSHMQISRGNPAHN